MKLTKHVLVYTALAAGLLSCSEENPWISDNGTGGIRITLKTDSQVKDALPTRAGEFTVPDEKDFSIRLEKTDGSIQQTWEKLEDFNEEESFPTGTYVLTAFYGDMEQQGTDMPYFLGSTELTVLEQRCTETDLTASIANSLISIDYTEAFRNYFSDYKTSVKSDGHAAVEVETDKITGDNLTTFVAPGYVNITVELTKPNGQSVTVQPASFTALPRHHYHLTLNVNQGNVGTAQLEIKFDDNVTEDNVLIDLTDELFTAPGPSIKTEGFEDKDELELLSYTIPANPYKFTIIGHGGLQEVNLTIASSSWTPAFGKEINLIGATESAQQQISASGIKVIGLFKNPQNLASVDITELFGKLPAGGYTISIEAKDKLTRVSSASLSFTSVALDLHATAEAGVYDNNEATINISYNGSDPRKDITFEALDEWGNYMPAEILSCTETTRTRSIPVKNYQMKIQLPCAKLSEVPVKVYLKGEYVQDVSIPLAQPDYTVTSDAYSRRLVLKLTAPEETDINSVIDDLRIYLNGNMVNSSTLTYNYDAGMIYISGLNPSSNYTVTTTLTDKNDPKAKTLSIRTENGSQIPNSDFSVKKETITKEMQVGGTYKAGAYDYTNWVKVIVNEPDGWASLNPLTFYEGAKTINSWFTVPSTFMEGNTVVIRSVGYDHNGTLPAKTGQFFSTTYYNTTVPSIANKSTGELFLGSYSYNGTASRTDGKSFDSRPVSVTFDYSYTPNGSEYGVATLLLYAADGTVIGEKTENLTASESMKTITLTIPRYAFGKKAASIRLSFKSTGGSSIGLKTPTGSELEEWTGTLPASPYRHWLPDNDYHTMSTGSVLKIANVKLNY